MFVSEDALLASPHLNDRKNLKLGFSNSMVLGASFVTIFGPFHDTAFKNWIFFEFAPYFNNRLT